MPSQIKKICLLTLLLAASLAMPAWAEQMDISITAGLGGLLPPGEPLVPVTVVLKNDQANATGMIEVLQTDNGMHDVTYRLPFESPASSTKRYTMFIRREQERQLVVRVRFAEEAFETLEKRDFEPPSKVPVVVSSGLPPIYLEQANHPKSYRFRQVPAEDLPTQALAYDSIHAVVLSGATLAELPADAVTALSQYLKTGGRLILVTPLAEDGFRDKVAALGLGDIDIWETAVHPVGAGVFASSGRFDQPTPFWLDAGKAIPQLTHPLFPNWEEEPDTFVSTFSDSLFQQLTKRKGTYGMSGFIWLALIVLGYILVIGPVDYWICRTTGKSQLTWVVFFSAIVLFSVIAYWYSTIVHSGNMQAIQVHVLDAASGQKAAKGNSMIWFYSTRNRTYDIQPARQAAVLTCREGRSSSSGIAPVDIQAQLPYQIDARVPVFSSKVFDATWQQGLDIPYSAQEEGTAFRLTLPQGQTVRAAFLATDEGLERLYQEETTGLWQRSEPERWARLLPGLASSMRSMQSSRRLPDQQELTDYLTWVSLARTLPREAFAQTEPGWEEDPVDDLDEPPGPGANTFSPGPTAFDHNAQIRDVMDRMEPRELALGVSHRLALGGRLLLLFLTPDSDLTQIELPAEDLETSEINLVRLQIPAAP